MAYDHNTNVRTSSNFAQQSIAAAQVTDEKDTIIANLTKTLNMLKEQIASHTKTIEKLTASANQNRSGRQTKGSDSDTDDTYTRKSTPNTSEKSNNFKHPRTSSSEEISVKKPKKGSRKLKKK